MNPRLEAKAEKVKFFITDVDGVLTDGRIIFTEQGDEIKLFHVHDGMGVKLGQKAGLKFAVITGRKSEIVARRAEELGVTEVYQGIEEKGKIFDQLLEKYGLTEEETAYIGDDINDLPVLERCGLALTVATGVDKVKEKVDYITDKKGGRGALREAVKLILEAKR